MPRQHQVTAVGGRQVDVHHLQGGELLQHRAGRQARRVLSGEILQRHLQAVGQEGDEDVRLDAPVVLMEDRAHREVVLEFLERLLDLGELVIAHTAGGGLTLQDTAEALVVRAVLPEIPAADRALTDVQAGRLRGFSVEFNAVSERREAGLRVVERADL